MKRCSVSSIALEITMRYHCTLSRSPKYSSTKCGTRENDGNTHPGWGAGGRLNLLNHFRKLASLSTVEDTYNL